MLTGFIPVGVCGWAGCCGPLAPVGVPGREPGPWTGEKGVPDWDETVPFLGLGLTGRGERQVRGQTPCCEPFMREQRAHPSSYSCINRTTSPGISSNSSPMDGLNSIMTLYTGRIGPAAPAAPAAAPVGVATPGVLTTVGEDMSVTVERAGEAGAEPPAKGLTGGGIAANCGPSGIAIATGGCC